jgi:hypothetical protein
MGFSGGSSNVTKAHTHSSSIVQDGGALNFDNVTQASLAAGDITYSDGNALQVLGIGSATDTLKVNAGATAPEWGSGGGGGGNYVLAESFTLDGAASTFTCTLATPISVSGFSEIVAVFNGQYGSVVNDALELQIRTNLSQPITNPGYSWGFINAIDAATVTGFDVDHFLVGPSTSIYGSRSLIIMHLGFNRTSGNFLNFSWTASGTVIFGSGGGYTYDSGTSTSFDGLVFTNSAGNNIISGSTVEIYKVTNS